MVKDREQEAITQCRSRGNLNRKESYDRHEIRLFSWHSEMLVFMRRLLGLTDASSPNDNYVVSKSSSGRQFRWNILLGLAVAFGMYVKPLPTTAFFRKRISVEHYWNQLESVTVC